jgi:hypothetical protein
MNLFDTQTLSPQDLFKGDICYYADGHAVEARLPHLLQVTKVVTVTGQSITLDNGRKFNLESCEETTRGSKGVLYEYSYRTISMVTEAQQVLSLLNDVEAIDFSSLSSQQLSMIKDVARGAFTQVTMPSPCGGGCGDTTQVAGIDVEVDPIASDVAKVLEGMRSRPLPTNLSGFAVIGDSIEQPEVTSNIAFNDASYELTPSELDAIENADDDDDDED